MPVSERRLILANIDQPGYTPDIECYLRNGGYADLKKALTMNAPDIVTEVKTSQLRGRGGAGFSCGMKWGFIDPKKNTKPVYLICNADESEPGTFKDKQIIYKDPHQLLEGMIIACYANNAHLAYIYIRGEFTLGAKILETALQEARDRVRSRVPRPSRRGRLHLRRGNGPDRIARGQAPLPAHQAALLSCRARPLHVPDHRQ